MFHSIQLVLIFAVIFSPFVRSEESPLLEALQEVQTELDELLAQEDRQQFYDDFYSITDLLKGLSIGEIFHDLEDGVHDNKTCHICNDIFTYGKSLLQNSQIVKLFANSICKKTGLYSERVCIGLLNRMADPVVYIIQHSKLTMPELCSVLLHPDCMAHLGKPLTKMIKWELPLPPISKRDNFKPHIKNEKQLKMLHISDFHLDLWYTPGSNGECNEPVCCRSTSYGSNTSSGYWSETYGPCDTPTYFLEKALNHMSKEHKDLDFVIWTGDNIPHDVWNTTEEVNLMHLKFTSDAVKKAFKGIKVFPSLGNHEAHPINMYVPHEVSEDKSNNMSLSWLYTTLADDYWSEYINTATAKENFRKYGSYSAMANEDLKVIVMNDNHCYNNNYWIGYDPHDPDGQLQWLINELDSAENNSIYAMIIGHVPPSEGYFAWTTNYMRIIERYEHLIVGSYFGHTHKDEILVYYNQNSKNESIPLSHSYIAPSVTTFDRLNPGYRVFTLDKTGKPLDFDMYYNDVIETNKRGKDLEPEWKKGFSAKESYGLKSLSTESWADFIKRAETDDNLIKLYHKHYHRFSIAYEEANDMSIKSQRQTLMSRKFINPINTLIKNDN